MPTDIEIWWVCVITFGAAVSQSALGFGFSLIAVPLMAFVVPTKTAVVVGFLHGCTMSFWLSMRLRGDVEKTIGRRLSVAALVGMPFGVAILGLAPEDVLRVGLGVVVCMAAIWTMIDAQGTRENTIEVGLSRSLTCGLGFISGVLNTSLSTNGPPLVYGLRRARVSGDRFRATISFVFTVSNAIGLPLLLIAGLVTGAAAELFAISLPFSIAGAIVGVAISGRLSHVSFSWLVDVTLVGVGLLTVAGGIIHLY